MIARILVGIAMLLAAVPSYAAPANSCVVVQPSSGDVDACAGDAAKCTTVEVVLEATAQLKRIAAAKKRTAESKEAAAKSAEVEAAALATDKDRTATAQTARSAADLASAEAEAAKKRLDSTSAAITSLFGVEDACKRVKLLSRYGDLLPTEASVFREAVRTIYNSQCADPDVVCLNTDGTAFNGRSLRAIAEGEKLTVRVLSLDASDSDRYQVLLTTAHNLDSLIRAARTGTADAAVATYTVVASATSAATGEKDIAIGFELERRDSKDAAYSHVSSGRVRVNHGSYYFEFGLGLPVVYHGTRKATSATEVTISTEPRAAISVLYFPFGRHKGQVDYHAELWSSLGVFAGTDVDFTAVEKDLHVGVAYSPIQGLGVAAGLSLVPVPFLASSSALTTNGMINTATHEVLRPFVGFFITTDFLNTASQAKTALLSIGR